MMPLMCSRGTVAVRSSRPVRLAPLAVRVRGLCDEAATAGSHPLRPPSTLEVSVDNEVASLLTNTGRANVLTAELCKELCSAIRELETQSQVKGLVLGSAVSGVFSGGADLSALLLDEDGSNISAITDYYHSLQELWLELYTTPLATVAAISGHAPAGGCMIALACDARVMIDNTSRIGLNQAAFGLVPAPFVSRSMADTIGQRPAERLVQTGAMLTANEALAVGLVDEAVPSLDALAGAVSARMAELLAVPHAARGVAKQQMRRRASDALRGEARDEDLDEFVAYVTSPGVQQAVHGHLAALSLGLAGPRAAGGRVRPTPCARESADA